jgi:hypothetical protein
MPFNNVNLGESPSLTISMLTAEPLPKTIKPTIAFSHLGCEKNRVDTEHMLGLLVQAGYSVDSNEELAVLLKLPARNQSGL